MAREIIWSYYPSDRSKQGTTEEVPDDMARQYVHEGLARYAPEKPVEPEPTDAEPTETPAPKKARIPAQAEAPKTS